MESLPDNHTPILMVDDDEGLLASVGAMLVSAGLPEPALMSESRRVLDRIRKYDFKVVLLDLIMPAPDGMETLKAVKSRMADVECVILTAVDDVGTAVEAMKYGAYDYLVKPFRRETLLKVVHHALERQSLRRGLVLYEDAPAFEDLKHPEAFEGIVAEDAAMARVFHQVEAVAPTDYPVLLSGETGTGKELLARAIHRLSGRGGGPFFAVNMGAFSGGLFDAEFFGHAKGAYTGAQSEKIGFFESAEGGTLFLDEITEMNAAMQGKLLRVLQEKELYRLGSTRVREIDVRVVTATNRDIHAAIGKGDFRADLFYRVSMNHIRIPALRERPADILPLARHFLKAHAARNDKPIASISPAVARRLVNYAFPGNIRELENIVASGVLAETGPSLTPAAVDGLIPGVVAAGPGAEELTSLAEAEKRYILKVLERTRGNRTQAAKILCIGLRTLQRKLKSYDQAARHRLSV